MNLSSGERARLQTTDEWLLEYGTGKPVMPGNLTKDLTQPPCIDHMLRYESHRTTKSGRLVLAFIDIESGQEVDAFFNVDIIKKRGEYKGTTYRTGLGGQFNVTSRYKFYNLWMDIVEEEPRRWSRVNKEMRSRLRKFLFTGEIKTTYRSDGSPYLQVKNLKKLDTIKAQKKYKLNTMKGQSLCTTN